VTFRIPGLPRVAPEAWFVGTEHFTERFGLFIILTLGESIVITGATTSELDLDTARVVAFGMAFLVTAALWWLYFSAVARIAQRHLELSEHRTVLARDAYTYLHVVIVAGVIVSAVGDELVIAHPTEVLPGSEIAAVVAGPAIYLLAHALFRLRMAGSVSWRRLGGALACLVVGLIGTFMPPLVVAALLIAVLVVVIGSEYISAARRRARGEPSSREHLEAAAEQDGD
jgi:low temperature requirement protein LtrA